MDSYHKSAASANSMQQQINSNLATKDTAAETHNLFDAKYGSNPVKTSANTVDLRHGKTKGRWINMWKVPSAIAILYLISWVTAAIHLIFFKVLDKQKAEGPSAVPQSYVATVSHVLGLLFRSTLCGSLTIASTQCLWRMLRLKTLKVSTIEVMFKITQNPFMMASPQALLPAKALYILALFTWLLPIAVTFPPGALIVVSTPEASTQMMTVPTYQGSFIGDGSGDSARRYSLADRRGTGSAYFYNGPIPAIVRPSLLTWETGNIESTPSPCGPDCEYHIAFKGPYLRCDSTASQRSWSALSELSRYCMINAVEVREPAVFETSLTVIPDAQDESSYIQHTHLLSCNASEASYDVTISYKEGVRTVDHTSTYRGPLQFGGAMGYLPQTNEDCRTNASECAPPGVLEVLTSYNHRALVDAFISPVLGNYTMTLDQQFQTYANGASHPIPCGGSLIGDTRLDMQRNNFTRTPDEGPQFLVTEEILNEALFNYTMNAALLIGFWSDTIEATVTNHFGTYSFADPKRLLIPYLVCLCISIPFICLGLRSLHLNGVSAIQDGFIQLLMTTNRSKCLDDVAAAGCLGGDENVPPELLNLRIRFGELVGSESNGVVRTGFGTNDETIPIRRGVRYGS